MKSIFSIILSLIFIQTISQTLHTGTYITSKKDRGFESDIFQFEKDGTFKYVFFTCTGTGFGKGKYKVTEQDSLKLQFIDCRDCDKTKELEFSSTSDDYLEINLRIESWEDNQAMPGVYGIFVSTETGTASDENGNLNIRLPKFDKDKIFEISFVGYDRIQIPIKKDYSYVKGIVRLTNNWVYNHQNIKIFKVIKWTDSKLQLQRYPKLAISYGKINTNKTEKIIKERMGEYYYEFYKEKFTNVPTNVP